MSKKLYIECENGKCDFNDTGYCFNESVKKEGDCYFLMKDKITETELPNAMISYDKVCEILSENLGYKDFSKIINMIDGLDWYNACPIGRTSTNKALICELFEFEGEKK